MQAHHVPAAAHAAFGSVLLWPLACFRLWPPPSPANPKGQILELLLERFTPLLHPSSTPHNPMGTRPPPAHDPPWSPSPTGRHPCGIGPNAIWRQFFWGVPKPFWARFRLRGPKHILDLAEEALPRAGGAGNQLFIAPLFAISSAVYCGETCNSRSSRTCLRHGAGAGVVVGAFPFAPLHQLLSHPLPLP